MTTSHYNNYWVITLKKNRVQSANCYSSLERAKAAAKGKYFIITDAQFGRALVNTTQTPAQLTNLNWISVRESVGIVTYPITNKQLAISNI
jgi:hypothetical protein